MKDPNMFRPSHTGAMLDSQPTAQCGSTKEVRRELNQLTGDVQALHKAFSELVACLVDGGVLLPTGESPQNPAPPSPLSPLGNELRGIAAVVQEVAHQINNTRESLAI